MRYEIITSQGHAISKIMLKVLGWGVGGKCQSSFAEAYHLEAEGVKQEESSDDEPLVEYFVGWDDMMEAAWRAPTTAARKKEFTKTIAPGESELDPVVAKWDDGYEHVLVDFTTLSWTTRTQAARAQAARTPSSTQPYHYVGQLPSGEAISVRDRADRGMLVSVFREKAQICQVQGFVIRGSNEGALFDKWPCC